MPRYIKSDTSDIASSPSLAAGIKELWDSDDNVDMQPPKKKPKRSKTTNKKRTKKPTSKFKKRASKGKVMRGDSDDELTLTEDEQSEDDIELPDFVRDRRTAFETTVDRFDEAGLRMPPDYSGLSLGAKGVGCKPKFDNIQPGFAFEDLELYSRGPNPKKSHKYLEPLKIGIIPAAIAQWLKPYQIDGVLFLLERFAWQEGGILGDDMGLGKTIQIIAFLTAAFGKTADSRDKKRRRVTRAMKPDAWYPKVLIICPTTLVDNWKSELETWGYWQVDEYAGSAKEDVLSAAKSGSVEIVITSYDLYRRNHDAINFIDWDCVVADECHKIKEPKAQITKAMNEINALARFGLTGTAVQNNYEELWTLLNWANPGAVSTLSRWKLCLSNPLRAGQAHNATVEQLGAHRNKSEALTKDLLPRFFIRRTKALIADQLPKKTDRVVFCPLTPLQEQAYTNFLNSDRVQLIVRSTEICNCSAGSRDKRKRGWCCDTHDENGVPWQNHMFPALLTLKYISTHLALLIPSMADPKAYENAMMHFKCALPDDWAEMRRAGKDSLQNQVNVDFCGKFRVLLKLLEIWQASGDKVLIFSHSVQLLRGLTTLCGSTGYSHSYLDGSMKPEERTQQVNRFNTDDSQFIFLISIRAGGIGLNITSANKVVIFDPNWNPSHDLQAQDRAYRLGQQRDVEVIRMISAGTIEEVVYARQIYKQQQANIAYTASLERRYFSGIQKDPTQKGELFGLQNIFSYTADQVVLKEIMNKTNIAESKAGLAIMDVELDGEDELLRLPTGPKSSKIKAEEDDYVDPVMKILADCLVSQAAEKAAREARKQASQARDPSYMEHVLAQAGVQYFHNNAEVLGTSKIESKLSRRAMERTTDAEAYEELAFASDNTVHEDDEMDLDRPRRYPIKFRPTEDIRIRQFYSMAQAEDMSIEDFAIMVEGWTQAQRRDFLDKFYRQRREELRDLNDI
ncbi:hypothetical protein BT63DRAFT_432944 [Microthyrium microscopicum]|uniref:DNA excision repair protein n=1 Tax=Microthyrium microscopicum TaxID=703497 RepID=A0A6A6UAJ8_9PEZI|nr:hypothetical protein BT63DRAFT_432944 [Microthyrium microscopicum]